MKNKLLFITALLSAGTKITAAERSNRETTGQSTNTYIPITCSQEQNYDQQMYVDEKVLEQFNFFAGLTESYEKNLSELELSPFHNPDANFVISVKLNQNEPVNKAGKRGLTFETFH